MDLFFVDMYFYKISEKSIFELKEHANHLTENFENGFPFS